MILADKIIRLRKKNGWSQEELAEKLGVSRQAVSNWESAQTVPDLEKVLRMSGVFGVTTDYLLKDEMEEEAFSDSVDSMIRSVSMEEANAYLDWRKTAAVRIAFATFLCILSPIPLMILGVVSEIPTVGMTANIAGAAGLILLVLMVAAAVAVFLHCGFVNTPYEFLDKEPFETEYGVAGMVREQQKAFRSAYAKYNIIGTVLCVLSPIVLFLGMFTEVDLLAVLAVSVMLLIIAVACVYFILAGVRWASMQKLLKEGEYSEEEKKRSKIKETVSTAYWLIVVAVFLGWSFAAVSWHSTWIVWPVAGVLYAAVLVLTNLLADRINEHKNEHK